MINSKALFYPSIEITDESWLKSNLLFWDEIKTIVPASLNGSTYNNKTTRFLSEKGILNPEIVHPDHHIVKELSENIVEYINTEEGVQLLNPNNVTRIHRDKMSNIHNDKLGHQMERLFRLHPSKLSHELQHMLEDGMMDNWITVNSSFASYYMTMLANKICEDTGLRLLTDDPLCSNLSSKVKLGIKRLNPENRHYRADGLNQQLAQGIFTNLMVQRIDFHSSTNAIDILSFKKDHRDELGLFRANLKKLLKEVSPDTSLIMLREEVESIYNDEFIPSFNNLKKKLDTSKLKWFADNFVKVGFFSAGATSIPIYLLGLTVPQALLAGAGVSIVSSIMSYNIHKENELRENPYNYLVEIENNLLKL